MSEKQIPEVSVVVPVYNSVRSLDELHFRLVKVFKGMHANYEIIMVDDGSSDGSYLKLKELRQKDKNVKIIKLIKNFGQQSALICGLNHTSGKYIVTIDDDLQNPPEEIPKLLKELKQGYDLIIGIPKIKRHNIFRNFRSSLITWLINSILGFTRDIKRSSFKVFTKEVCDNVVKIKSSFPYLPAYIAQVVSFDKITNVVISHNERRYGNSNYSLKDLIKFLYNLIFNYSLIPLKIMSAIGLLLSTASIIYGIILIIRKVFFSVVFLHGWLSIIVFVAFLGGLILFTLGIVGEYLIRIITELTGKPIYIVEEKIID